MDKQEELQADIQRIERLKELALCGSIGGPSSYFGHLIDMYGEIGRPGADRTFTTRERERIDLFIKSFAAGSLDPSPAEN
jgi:hypothetical protein